MKIHSLNCASFCPMSLYRLKTEMEKFQQNRLLGKAQKFFERPELKHFLNKLSTIPHLQERLEQLKVKSEDYLQVDLEKEKIFSEQFQELTTNVLLIESKDRLILVDTGIGKKQISQKNASFRNVMSGLLTGLNYQESQTAHEQIKQLGFSPTDVTDIVLSHMDMDHVGGLSDFPQARAHLYNEEFGSANHPKGTYEKKRFMKDLWQDHKNFCLYENKGEDLFGFHLTPLKDIDDDIFLVDLFGHTRGHAGLFLKEKNYLFAGDSFINQIQIEDDYTPVSIRIYKKLTTTDEGNLNSTLLKLKSMCASGTHVCCSHDKHQFLTMKDYLEEDETDG